MLLIGQTVGNYTIISDRLGSGSQYGHVHKARHTNGDVEALKVCTNAIELARFHQENAILYSLTPHESIITPTTQVIENNNPNFTYYCMELAISDIETYLIKNPGLSFDERKNIFLQICSGMKHAHRHDVVHRDLHYGNILIKTTDPIVIKLTDFGLAKNFAVPSLRQYPAGMVVGRADTRAPETYFKIWDVASLKNYVLSSDVYSLGIILAFLYQKPIDPYLYDLYFNSDGLYAYLNKNGILIRSNVPTIDHALPPLIRLKHYHNWLQQYNYNVNIGKLHVSLREADKTSKINAIIDKCCVPDYLQRYQDVNDIINDMSLIV